MKLVREGDKLHLTKTPVRPIHPRRQRTLSMRLQSIVKTYTALLMGLSLASPLAQATLPIEALFQHETMPSRHATNIVTISDANIPNSGDGRVHFVDVDRGHYLGALNTGYWYSGVILPRTRDEIISPETYFERGTRGKRTDIVAFYDPKTLENTGEVIIPSKRMTAVKPQATSALTDDENFLAVLNLTPATSISIVNIAERKFVTEIEIPGCTNIYPTGIRNFNAICADGSFMDIEIDDEGQLVKRTRRKPSFNPQEDLITNGGVRIDNTWVHLSHQSNVYEFTTLEDGSINQLHWSLLTPAQRQDNWRIGGMQQLAIHKSSGLLYALMIQGDQEVFEDPTEQVWVYDMKTQKRVKVLELEFPALFINVSQSDTPQLYAVGADLQMPFLFSAWIYLTEGEESLIKRATLSFDTYDADSGDHLHSISRIGKFPNLIQPWR